jgi:flagellar basal body-associated protein FliL
MAEMNEKWTILSLKEYIETLFLEKEKQQEQKFVSLDRAVTKAEIATEKRFESVNEFRATLADQQRMLIPRLEYEVAHKALLEKLEDAQDRLEKLENIKQSKTALWAYVIGVGGFLTGIISLILGYVMKMK